MSTIQKGKLILRQTSMTLRTVETREDSYKHRMIVAVAHHAAVGAEESVLALAHLWRNTVAVTCIAGCRSACGRAIGAIA